MQNHSTSLRFIKNHTVLFSSTRDRKTGQQNRLRVTHRTNYPFMRMSGNHQMPWNDRLKSQERVVCPLSADLNATVLTGHDAWCIDARGCGIGILPITGEVGPTAQERLSLAN